MKFLIDGDTTEHMGHPRCRIKWTMTKGPRELWHGELVEWIGDPEDVGVETLVDLFQEASKALYEHKEKA